MITREKRNNLEEGGHSLTTPNYLRGLMSRFKIGFTLTLFTVSLTQTVRPLGHRQGDGKISQTEQKLSQLFPSADPSKHIYAVSSDHVLLSLFDKEGALTEISVVPRYYLNDTHPDWTEPDVLPSLSESAYRHLLSLIGQVKSLGQVNRKNSGSAYVTNDQYPILDEYDDCVVQRFMRSGSHVVGPNNFQVASFHVFFFHLVTGRLSSIPKAQKVDGSEKVCSVGIEGNGYWLARKDCERLEIGHPISVMAAGPTNEPRRVEHP